MKVSSDTLWRWIKWMDFFRKATVFFAITSLSRFFLGVHVVQGIEPPTGASKPATKTSTTASDEVAALESELESLMLAGKFGEAAEVAGRVATLRERAHEPYPWQARDARPRAESLARLASRPQAVREAFATLGVLDAEARTREAAGRFAEAQPFIERGLKIRKEARGDDDLDTASSLHNLAANLRLQGLPLDALPMIEKAVSIHRKALGENHPDTATCYSSLATILHDLGRFSDARLFHEKALVIRRRILSENHAETARSYANLASSLSAAGLHAEALALNQKALDIRLKLLGERDRSTLVSYNNLGLNLDALERHAEARVFLEKSLKLQREVVGENHPTTAMSYSNLGANLNAQGLYDQARPLLEEALAIRRKTSSEGHPDTARIYNNLALNLNAQGHTDEAISLLEKASKIQRVALGEVHPARARILDNLAASYYRQRRFEEAERVWTAAADSSGTLRGKVGGSGIDRSIGTASHSPTVPLAALLARQGKANAAWERYEQGLGRGLLDDLFARESARLKPEDEARRLKLFKRFNQLDTLARDLAGNPARRKATPEALDKLEQDRVETQAEWEALRVDLESTYGALAGLSYDLKRIQAQIPDDSALVGWLDFQPTPAREGVEEHWAVVVRKTGPPRWVSLSGDDWDLGSRLGAVLSDRSKMDEPIEPALEKLTIQRFRPIEPFLHATETSPKVRRLIVLPSPGLRGLPVGLLAKSMVVSYAPSATIHAWLQERWLQPIPSEKVRILAVGDPWFQGGPSNAPKSVPISPDKGAAIRAVFMGSIAERSGLREGDVVLAYSGQSITTSSDLESMIQGSADSREKLGVRAWREGNVIELTVDPGELGVLLDDLSPSKAIAREREFERFLQEVNDEKTIEPLPGTRLEVEAISSLFEKGGSKVDRRLGVDASEQALRRLASEGELSGYRFLHFATHGVIDDQRACDSALLLSNDQQADAIDAALSGREVDDGRLTAAEIAQTWTLNADLAVLSACKTGIGRYVNGEGYLGFAQALMVSGARSVLLSLWKVDDTATTLLMTRFYANVLGARDGLSSPLSKAEALREAQAWLRGLEQDAAERLIKTDGERGKKVALPPVTRRLNRDISKEKPFSHPYYWAAFIIFGE